MIIKHQGRFLTLWQESFEQFWLDALDLIEQHALELNHFDLPIAIDHVRYQALDHAGVLRIFALRDGLANDSEVIGYGIFLVSHNAHHQTSLQAIQDALYLDPACRRGRLGIDLVKACDAHLVMEGVEVIYHGVKLAHPALGRILERQGYTAIDTLYGKRVNNNG